MDSFAFFSQREQVLSQRGLGPRLPPRRASRGEVPEGVHDRHLGPLSWSLEAVLLQGKRLGVHHSRLFTAGTSTATTGAWPLPTITASACVGVHGGEHGPFRRSPETAVLQGKRL